MLIHYVPQSMIHEFLKLPPIHFLKYYAVHIEDLTCLDKAYPEFFISGMDSRGTSASITWNATFTSTNAQTVSPILFVRTSKVLKIGTGRSIEVI